MSFSNLPAAAPEALVCSQANAEIVNAHRCSFSLPKGMNRRYLRSPTATGKQGFIAVWSAVLFSELVMRESALCSGDPDYKGRGKLPVPKPALGISPG